MPKRIISSPGVLLFVLVSAIACTSPATSLSEPGGRPATAVPTATATPSPGRAPSPQVSPSTTAAGTGAVSAAPSASESKSAAGKPSRVKYIDWVTTLGVAGGADDPREAAVALLAHDKCDAVRQLARDAAYRLPSVYDAAGAACLAAFHGRTDLWSYVGTVAARLRQPRDCIEQAVSRLVRGLVEKHHEAPTARFRRTPAPSGSTFPCPRITQLSPAHGPSAGGYQLTVSGVHLPPMFVVHFAQSVDLDLRDIQVSARSSNGKEAVVVVPRRLPGAEPDVAVYPEGWPLAPVATEVFRYDPWPGGGRQPAPPSPSASPTTDPPEEWTSR